MRAALRSWWAEPRAPDNPGRLYWDKWLVAGLIATAILEAIFRTDAAWRPLAVAIAIAGAITLLWRRTHPLTVVALLFGSVTLLNIAVLIGGDASFGLYTMAYVLLVPYALLRWGSGRESVLGLVIILVSFVLSILADTSDLGETLGGGLILFFPAALGAAFRYRANSQSREKEQIRLLEREQLARELHDTVAHHVSAIAIQAQAGRTVAAGDPDAAMEALEVIEEEASRTLAEMRTMVGALRQGEEPELAPQRGLADVKILAGSVDEPAVEVELFGDLSGLQPAVDAALYRLAQESITNAVRHARDATMVKVRVVGEGPRVRLTVRDDGIGPPPADSDSGYGLIGMKERATLLGGTFKAGPGEDGGWTVTAVLPKNGSGR